MNLPLTSDFDFTEAYLSHFDRRETESVDLDCPLSVNENQKAIVSLVLHNLYNVVENNEYYYQL